MWVACGCNYTHADALGLDPVVDTSLCYTDAEAAEHVRKNYETLK